MNASDILALDDVQIQTVEVPEWRTTLHVRSLSGHERAKLVGRVKLCEKDGSDPSVYVVLHCCCDAEGKLLFDGLGVEKLGGKSAAALDRIATAAIGVNGLGSSPNS